MGHVPGRVLPKHFLQTDARTYLSLLLLLYLSTNPRPCPLGSGLTSFVLFTHSQPWGRTKGWSWLDKPQESCKPTASPAKRCVYTRSSGSTAGKPYAWPKKSSPEEGFPPGMCEPGEESPGPRSVAATIAHLATAATISHLASLSARTVKVTASPGEDCPAGGCWSRGDEAGRAWQPGWDQKQKLAVKAKRSEARSWDSWGCPQPKAGNQWRARTWGGPACAQPWPDETRSSHRLGNRRGEERSQTGATNGSALQPAWMSGGR